MFKLFVTIFAAILACAVAKPDVLAAVDSAAIVPATIPYYGAAHLRYAAPYLPSTYMPSTYVAPITYAKHLEPFYEPYSYKPYGYSYGYGYDRYY